MRNQKVKTNDIKVKIERHRNTNSGAEKLAHQIACQIVRIRTQLKMTQNQLAERSGLKLQDISRMEAGDVSTTLGMLIKVAGGFGKKLVIKYI